MPALLDTQAVIRERQGNMFWFKRVYIDATPSTGLIGRPRTWQSSCKPI